jgi:rare lipoprotein A
VNSIRSYSVGGFVLVGLVFLSGCAPYRAEPPSQAQARAVVNPPRSDRGNPPFYEVYGHRYYVLDTSDGYHERGIASWYGPDFHGKPTSGGERYDMHALTAAHKTLPIPTWVEVTNLANGKHVIVKINDRGPFVGNRIIDLSYRAAQELDMIRNGTARVEVRALGVPAGVAPDAAVPVTTTASTAPPSRPSFSIISTAEADVPRPGDQPLHQLYVQVGAFADRDNAATLVARLKRGGFGNSFIVSSSEGRTTLHRVRIGPLANPEQFDSVRLGLRKIGVDESRLVVDN